MEKDETLVSMCSGNGMSHRLSDRDRSERCYFGCFAGPGAMSTSFTPLKRYERLMSESYQS
jgi:hypothetical protein